MYSAKYPTLVVAPTDEGGAAMLPKVEGQSDAYWLLRDDTGDGIYEIQNAEKTTARLAATSNGVVFLDSGPPDENQLWKFEEGPNEGFYIVNTAHYCALYFTDGVFGCLKAPHNEDYVFDLYTSPKLGSVGEKKEEKKEEKKVGIDLD